MPIAEANGISICYEERGAGEPLLLIMGLSGQLIDWSDPFLDCFVDRGFRVIVFDNRDIGLSTESTWEPPSPRRAVVPAVARRVAETHGYYLADMADDAFGLLSTLGIERAHVAGISMGGMIAQTMAIEHPDRVASLTSIMSNTGDRRHGMVSSTVLAKLARLKPADPADAAKAGTEMFSWWAGSDWDRDDYLRRARIAVARSYRPKGIIRQLVAIAASPDRTAALGTVTVPTLVIHGLQDKLVLPSGGVTTAKAVPDSRLLMFPEMGHDIPLRRFDEVADAITANAQRPSAASTLVDLRARTPEATRTS